jgi:hypothetical protein
MSFDKAEGVRAVGFAFVATSAAICAYAFTGFGFVTKTVELREDTAHVQVRNVCFSEIENVTVELVPASCSDIRHDLSSETLGQRHTAGRRYSCTDFLRPSVKFADVILSRFLPFELLSVRAPIQGPVFSAKVTGPFGAIHANYGMSLGSYILMISILFWSGNIESRQAQANDLRPQRKSTVLSEESTEAQPRRRIRCESSASAFG